MVQVVISCLSKGSVGRATRDKNDSVGGEWEVWTRVGMGRSGWALLARDARGGPHSQTVRFLCRRRAFATFLNTRVLPCAPLWAQLCSLSSPSSPFHSSPNQNRRGQVAGARRKKERKGDGDLDFFLIRYEVSVNTVDKQGFL